MPKKLSKTLYLHKQHDNYYNRGEAVLETVKITVTPYIHATTACNWLQVSKNMLRRFNHAISLGNI